MYFNVFDKLIEVIVSDRGAATYLRGKSLKYFVTMFDSFMEVGVTD